MEEYVYTKESYHNTKYNVLDSLQRLLYVNARTQIMYRMFTANDDITKIYILEDENVLYISVISDVKFDDYSINLFRKLKTPEIEYNIIVRKKILWIFHKTLQEVKIAGKRYDIGDE